MTKGDRCGDATLCSYQLDLTHIYSDWGKKEKGRQYFRYFRHPNRLESTSIQRRTQEHNSSSVKHFGEAPFISFSGQHSQPQRQLSILGLPASIAALLFPHDLSCHSDCLFARL
jgi:hypothetical protein